MPEEAKAGTKAEVRVVAMRHVVRDTVYAERHA
jgi:hypothetical protein